MTAPQDDATTPANRPARGRLGRPAVAPSGAATTEAADVAQGQAAAVLGALARMQLRLDVLAREQSDMFARLLARIDQLEGVAVRQALAGRDAVAPAPPWPGEIPVPVVAPTTEEPLRTWRDTDR